MSMVSENYQLKWHSFTAHLHTSVATSLHSEAFTDVSLFTADGHQINAHRFILSACSQYLHKIFKHQSKMVTNLPLLVIMPPEINYKTLKTLIQYMYCGETTVSNDILENVLRGGDILQVRGLWRPKSESQKAETPPSSMKTPVIVLPKPSNNVLRTVDSNIKVLDNQQIEKKKSMENQSSRNNEAEQNTNNNNDDEDDNRVNEQNKDQTEKEKDVNFLVIKQEPIEWNELQEVEMTDGEMFHTEMTIKPEIIFPEEEGPEETEELYSPLTCELCSEVFRLPAEWVRHIRTHTDMQPAKRQRRGRVASVEEDDSFPPLQCDLCQKQFLTPADWVRHIQNTHTDKELAQSNNSAKSRVPKPLGFAQKMCTICNKKFPSHASMLIHKRTHTGERPFICEYCQKGFNVKSNLLRHLRTLHDKIIASTDVSSDNPN